MKNKENRVTKKETAELEKQLESRVKLEEFLKDNKDEFLSHDVGEMVKEILEERKISKAEAARRSKMSDVYLFQIISGRRQPSRDRLLCLCIGLGCSLEETRIILKKGRFAELYARDRRDAVIIYGIEQKWDLSEVNDALFESGEKTLV